jgi:L-rhamnose mutarotase
MTDTKRAVFISRIKPDRLGKYRERHQHVWPEMRQALREAGWGNYSLFLTEDGLLIGYVETDDFQAARDRMADLDVNKRWQAEMAQFFDGPEGRPPDQGFVIVEEIFHLD